MSERVTFGWEKLETLLAEPNIRDLITEFWQELWPHDHIPVDPDWSRLLRAEAAGEYKVWAARVGPTLAGFASFFIGPYVFAKTTIFAIDHGHFLAPDFRDNSRLGWRMWKTAKAALKAEGAQMMYVHDNARRPLMPFFLALGLEPCSTWFRGEL